MGKKQHSKDRAYLTTTEWRTEWGGFKGKEKAPFKRLPFNCCAITFTPFEDPVCTEDGNVYDIVHAVPYVMKFKRHPITGQPLALKDLVKLNFHKNTDGEYACPVMGKVFTVHTHIVAIKTSGNVYCWDAVEELCVKPKNWKDLITDEPFTRKDIIQIQDPMNLEHRNIQNYDHVKKELMIQDEEEGEGKDSSCIRNASEDMKRALGALGTKESEAEFQKGGGGKRAQMMVMLTEAKAGQVAPSAKGGQAADASKNVNDTGEGDWRMKAPIRDEIVPMPRFKPGASTWDTDDPAAVAAASAAAAKAQNRKKSTWGGPGGKEPGSAAGAAKSSAPRGMTPQERYEAEGHVKYEEGASTTGAASRSFTSTCQTVTTVNKRSLRRVDRNPSKKGYVRLHTNLGDLNFELSCDLAPRTCENFIALCEMGYYEGTTFHRSIKNFMVQGGDPTGTGTGGESIYGPNFKDELDSRLVHNGRGILSMANSGPNSNGSQFFISYKSCRHLDFKHSVFGRVVGGFEVLSAMEKVPCDSDDHPTTEIKILSASVFANPYKEMEEEEKKSDEAKAAADAKASSLANPEDDGKVGRWFSNPSHEQDKTVTRTGVGKYLSLSTLPEPIEKAAASVSAAEGVVGSSEAMPPPANNKTKAAPALGSSDAMPPPAKKKKAAPAFGNFDAW